MEGKRTKQGRYLLGWGGRDSAGSPGWRCAKADLTLHPWSQNLLSRIKSAGSKAHSAPEEAPPYLEKPQDVGYHDGDRTPRSPNHSNYFLRLDENRRLPVGAAHVGGVLLDKRLDESERLFERISVPRTSVQDPRAQRHVGQQVGIAVDLVQGVEHCFQPVDPVLPLDVAARDSAGTLGVHWEQPPEGDVPLDPDRMRGVHLLATRRRRQRAQEHLQHAAGELHQSQDAEQLPQLDHAAPAAAVALAAAAPKGTVVESPGSKHLGVSFCGEAQGFLLALMVREGLRESVGGPAAPASLGRRALSVRRLALRAGSLRLAARALQQPSTGERARIAIALNGRSAPSPPPPTLSLPR